MGTERTRELRRRRHRKKKVAKLIERSKKTTTSDKALIIERLRRLTPGGETIAIDNGLLAR